MKTRSENLDPEYKKKLERNLWLYTLARLFYKRAYLPLIAIYAVTHAHVSLEQIGIIASITALVVLLLEIPSGYIADKVGHKKTLLFGSALIALAPLGYIFWPNFFGILFGMVVYFAGQAFYSGTFGAFLHETLLELDRDDQFAKIAGRTQMWSLLGNVVLIALVPLTYTIDSRLPFIIGFFLQSLTVVAIAFMTTPIKTHKDVLELLNPNIFELLKEIRRRKEIFFFLFLGVVIALSNKIPEFRELYFQEVGVPLWAFGFILATTSLFGAFLSYHVDKAEKLPEKTFYLLDALSVAFIAILVGIISHPVLGVLVFIFDAGYFRVRHILLQTYVLRNCPTRKLKATYLSMLSFFGASNSIWVALVLGYAIGYFGIQRGYFLFGIGAVAMVFLLYIVSVPRRERMLKNEKLARG